MADDELTPPADDASDDQPDKDWQAEATKWKALARKHEKAAKDNADAAKRLAEIEESGKTEQERLAEAHRTANERATAAERESARLRVALKKGLTEAQVRRLVGDTEEELEADADELLGTELVSYRQASCRLDVQEIAVPDVTGFPPTAKLF